MQSGIVQAPQKVGVYGPGGIGKTKLSSLLAKVGVRPLLIDLEGGSHALDVERLSEVTTWDDLRAAVQDKSLLDPYGAVVIDSATKAEEMCMSWVLANVKDQAGNRVERVEDYGYGKGYSHIYETFLALLGDLDAVARSGKHVVVICHDCTANVPNPAGEDWIQYQPRLQNPPKGSVRHRLKEWCDHLLFVGYDVMTNKDGKGIGSGTRTIYPTEMPTHWAKSRRLSQAIPYSDGSAELWNQLLNR